MTELSARHEEWLVLERGLDAEVVARMGIFSGRRGEDGEVVADRRGNILAFPFLRNGEAVAVKYRTADKRMWQRKGGVKTLYNADVLDDPGLADGKVPLVITEGEIDALSAVSAGHPWAVSVPDGAPPARKPDGTLIVVPEGADDIVPEEDVKYGFLQLDWERLAKVKRIIIATDTDEPGERLAAELVRRLGRVRCSRAAMPEGCKDLNELLLRDGSAAVLDAIHNARPYPVSGLYTIDELPEEPPLNPVSTGWPRLDPFVKVYRPALMVVSGFANAGKSTWTMQLAANLIVTQGWPLALASFEMRHTSVLEQVERCLAEALEVHWHPPLLKKIFTTPWKSYTDVIEVFKTKDRKGLLGVQKNNKTFEKNALKKAKSNTEKINDFDIHIYLPGQLLSKVDRTSMMHSLEIRSPFLDTKLAEYVYNLPVAFKMSKNANKIILKDILSETFPKDFVYRRKQGFGAPIGAWLLKEDLQKKLAEIFSNQKHPMFIYIKYDKALQIKENAFHNMKKHAPQLWSLFCLALWFEQHHKHHE